MDGYKKVSDLRSQVSAPQMKRVAEMHSVYAVWVDVSTSLTK